MGFLKKSSAPSELPNLAIDGLASSEPVKESPAVIPSQPLSEPSPVVAQPVVAPVAVAPVAVAPVAVAPVAVAPVAVAPVAVVEEKQEIAAESPSEVPRDNEIGSTHKEIKKIISENLLGNDESVRASFFDEVLEDINSGIADTEKLGDWYEKKFMKEDVVGNMKGYWEGNKADIIIKSFGAEYKKQINDKVMSLRELEEDWREVYFRLVKKEEEMKKEERELKEIVSEFVSLCKRRNHNEEERKGKEE